jgi:hypothetical protein
MREEESLDSGRSGVKGREGAEDDRGGGEGVGVTKEGADGDGLLPCRLSFPLRTPSPSIFLLAAAPSALDS